MCEQTPHSVLVFCAALQGCLASGCPYQVAIDTAATIVKDTCDEADGTINFRELIESAAERNAIW